MAFRQKECASCTRTFTPRSGAAKRCDDCRAGKARVRTASRSRRRATVKDDTLLDLLEAVRREYEHASPASLRCQTRSVADSVAARDRPAARRALIDLAAQAVVLADRPDRIAMPPPTLHSVPA